VTLRAARVDANQAEIVDALRACGCCVAVTSSVGGGFPDLVVWSPRRGLLLFEVKDGSKPLIKRKRTTAQIIWHANWKGPVYIVSNVDEALSMAGVKWI
jgi:hypothetical protein